MKPYLPPSQEQADHQDELTRCASDPVYWINTYAQAYDPRTAEKFGPFILDDEQVKFVRWMEECDRLGEGGVVLKCRDRGVTFICGFCALHAWLFKPGDATGFGSLKLDQVDELGNPKSIFEKIRMTYRQLPDWMREAQSAGFIWSKHSTQAKFINPANGATIFGEGGDNIGRGGRASRYFLDESAHVEHAQLIDASLSKTTNVRIDVSTPKGLNHFYTKWRGNGRKFRLSWINDKRYNMWEERDANGRVVNFGIGRHPTAPIPTSESKPERDERGHTVIYTYYEGPHVRQKAEYQDPAILAQEIDGDFVGSGRPRFNRRWLMQLRDAMYPNNDYALDWQPVRTETRAWMGTLTTFIDPEDDHDYLILVDTAKGLTPGGLADWSVAHVWDLSSAEQVAHYRGQMVEGDYATDLYTLGMMYNRALIVVETPGPGEAVLSYLGTVREGQSQAYPNIYHHRDDDVYNKKTGLTKLKEPGWKNTSTSKPEADGKLATMLQEAEKDITGAILIRHVNTVEELVHYVRVTRDRCEAEAGAHDDEVSCMRMLAMVWGQYTTRGKVQLRQLTPAKPKAFTGSQGGRR